MTTHLGPQGALNSHKQLPRDTPGEANGRIKPPNPIRKHIWTCFPKILTPKSMKTRAHESKESKNQGAEGPPGCAKRLNDNHNDNGTPSRCRTWAPQRSLTLFYSHTRLHMRWMHGSTAASANRTEIRHCASGTCRRVCFDGCLALHPALPKCLSLARRALSLQANL